MKSIIYVHDFCFLLNDNNVYTAVGMPENYFDRFFDIGVDNVYLISRNKQSNKPSILSTGFEVIKNKNIKMPIKIKCYFSLLNPRVIMNIIHVIKNSDLLVINFPSIIGLFIWFLNKFIGKSYTLEVAADYDQFSSKKCGFIVSYFFKLFFPLVVGKSEGCTFVSKYLSDKYKHENSIISSNVKIDNVCNERYIGFPLVNKPCVNILMAGGVNKRKGVDVAIKAILKLKSFGLNNVKLNIAGGHFDDNYQQVVSNFFLDDNVIFHGLLNQENLHRLYEKSDIYIQPSRAEGIPRATIEAMSFGLPVVGTTLPGFKEILSGECLVTPGSSDELFKKILKFITDIDFYNSMSKRNLKLANDFLYQNLHDKRTSFYANVLGKENERL